MLTTGQFCSKMWTGRSKVYVTSSLVTALANLRPVTMTDRGKVYMTSSLVNTVANFRPVTITGRDKIN